MNKRKGIKGRVRLAQVVDSLSGDLMDEFVLTKPPDWAPDQGRQLHTLALFHRWAPCMVALT
jgi:hypothetical protein